MPTAIATATIAPDVQERNFGPAFINGVIDNPDVMCQLASHQSKDLIIKEIKSCLNRMEKKAKTYLTIPMAQNSIGQILMILQKHNISC